MVVSADPRGADGADTEDDKRTRAENERSADALFETRSLDEIKQVRWRAARDAEGKDEELRARVGSSYRDAIATADEMLAMETTAANAVATLASAVKVLEDLSNVVSSIGSTADGRSAGNVSNATKKKTNTTIARALGNDKHEDALFVAGTRVKFLVDTPEFVWGCLEAVDVVGAGRRFLAARDVLATLDGGSASSAESGKNATTSVQTTKAFPLVKQQSILLRSFRQQIARAARVALADAPALCTPKHVVAALAALCCVEDLTVANAAEVFLQTRRAWIRAALHRVRSEAETAGPGLVVAACAAVCREARRVPGVLAACFGGDLDARGDDFAEDAKRLRAWGASNFDKLKLKDTPLVLVAIEALDGTDDAETFSGFEKNRSPTEHDDESCDAPPPTASESCSSEVFRGVADPLVETARRLGRASGRGAAIGAMPTAQTLARLYQEWLAGVAQDVAKAASHEKLFAGVKTLARLADVERAVFAAERKHCGEFQSNAPHADTDASPSDTVGAACERARVAMLHVGSNPLAAPPQTPWSSLLEQPHAARARELLEESFMFTALRVAVETKLASTKAPPQGSRIRGNDAGSMHPERNQTKESTAPSPEGQVLWTEGFRAVDADGDENETSAGIEKTETRASRESREARQAPTPPTLSAAIGLAREMNFSLARTRRDVVAFASARDGLRRGAGHAHRSSSWIGPQGSVPHNATARLARLESFVHETCVGGVSSFVSFLSAKLDGFESAVPENRGSQKRKTIEQTLLVAALASCAARENQELAVFLGPSSGWVHDDTFDDETTSHGRRRGDMRNEASSAGGSLSLSTEALSGVANRGFALWAASFGGTVAADFVSALADDGSLVSEETREDWDEDPPSFAAEGINQRLPTLPSPHAFHVLHETSLELLRCGGHGLPRAATKALTARVAKDVLQAIDLALSGGKQGKGNNPGPLLVGEKGALQFLFDAQWMGELLLHNATGGGDGDAEKTSAEAKLLLKMVTKKLSFILDPIDWATYETPLGRNVQRAIARSACVLGLCTSRPFSRKMTASTEASDGTQQTTTRPPPPRFAYLPVGAVGGSRFTSSAHQLGSYRSGGSFSQSQTPKGELLDWSTAGFDSFGDATTRVASANNDPVGGNFFGKLAGQGLGLGKAAAASMSTWAL